MIINQSNSLVVAEISDVRVGMQTEESWEAMPTNFNALLKQAIESKSAITSRSNLFEQIEYPEPQFDETVPDDEEGIADAINEFINSIKAKRIENASQTETSFNSMSVDSTTRNTLEEIRYRLSNSELANSFKLRPEASHESQLMNLENMNLENMDKEAFEVEAADIDEEAILEAYKELCEQSL
jgi:hypothetical protein